MSVIIEMNTHLHPYHSSKSIKDPDNKLHFRRYSHHQPYLHPPSTSLLKNQKQNYQNYLYDNSFDQHSNLTESQKLFDMLQPCKILNKKKTQGKVRNSSECFETETTVFMERMDDKQNMNWQNRDKKQMKQMKMDKAEDRIARSKMRIEELEIEIESIQGKGMRTQCQSRDISVNKVIEGGSLRSCQKLVQKIKDMLQKTKGGKIFTDMNDMWRALKKKVSQAEKMKKLKEGINKIIQDKEIVRTEEIQAWIQKFN